MILGIDWGAKKVGFAVADAEMTIATALKALPNTPDIFAQITDMIATYDVSRIVIGRSAHDTQNDNTEAITEFARLCRTKCDCDVVFAEEMFSTRQARHNLAQRGAKIGAHDDAESARIILQGYCDAQKQKM